MNKGELIAALANKTEMTKKDSEAALNAVLDVIAESMAKGEKVQLIGFGTFEAKNRPARVARNPRTGASVKIAACKAPAFKAPAAARLRDFSLRKRSKKLQKHNICAKLTAQVLLYGFIQGRNSYDR